MPLSQHIGAPALPVVSEGERVLRGQLIARRAEGLSANVYAPVAGTVKGIVGHILPAGKKGDHILIENDFSDESVSLPRWGRSRRRACPARIGEAGIVGMGGAGLSHRRQAERAGQAEVLVVNGAECEPYITCDESIMLGYPDEFLLGVRFAMLACGAERAVIGIEGTKKRRSPSSRKSAAGRGISP